MVSDLIIAASIGGGVTLLGKIVFDWLKLRGNNSVKRTVNLCEYDRKTICDIDDRTQTMHTDSVKMNGSLNSICKELEKQTTIMNKQSESLIKLCAKV